MMTAAVLAGRRLNHQVVQSATMPMPSPDGRTAPANSISGDPDACHRAAARRSEESSCRTRRSSHRGGYLLIEDLAPRLLHHCQTGAEFQHPPLGG
jgi:hypothetical protein